MAWGRNYRNWDVPRLTTYEAAARHESITKPIRGDKNGTKPLGDRKKKYFNIRKEGDDIVVRMHSTDIVRYKPSGELILNNGGWVSPSTHDMFHMLIGLHMQTFNSRTWVDCYIANAEGQIRRGDYPFPNNTPVKATRHEGGWFLEGIGLTVVHHINRKAANKVRKEYAEFKAYLSGITKLRTEYRTNTHHWTNKTTQEAIIKVSREELAEYGLEEPSGMVFPDRQCASRADNLKGLMLSNRTEDNYRAALTVMRSSHYSRYWIGPHGIVVEPSRIPKIFDQLLLFIHRNEVLEKKIVTTGSIIKDSYAHWVGA